MVRAIGAALEPLRDHPLAGPSRGGLAAGVRVLLHRPYAIYYLPRSDEVVVLRVLHGARDVVALREELRRQARDAGS